MVPKEEPMSTIYGVSEKNATRKQEDRNRVAQGILKDMSLRQMRHAIARANRKTRDKAGRQWKVGPKVAELICQLWFRDGQGEASDGSIHQTGFAWQHEEGAFTESELRTARRVGEEEGLLESWVGHRPRDRQRTVYYRLDLWEVARLVARSELRNVGTLLETEGRKVERERLAARREELRQTITDLDVIDLGAEGAVVGAADAEPEGDKTDSDGTGRVLTICKDRDVNLQVLHNSAHTTGKEKEPVGSSKKSRGAACSLPVSSQNTKKPGMLTDAEAEERWEELVATSPHGRALTALASLMAERNATKQVAVSRVWRTLGSRFTHWTSRLDLSEDAWDHGLWAALVAEAPSIGYARKAAQRHDSREGI